MTGAKAGTRGWLGVSLGVVLASALGCGGGASRSGGAEALPKAETAEGLGAAREHDPARSWGTPTPSGPAPELALKAELERGSVEGELEAVLDGEGRGLERDRALWSVARIGGAEALDRALAELDAADAQALAAAALLDVPASEPGSPPDPGAEGLDPRWRQLEDGLWTRYAVTDPHDLANLGALALAIARVGGGRSIERMGVELAGLEAARAGEDGAALRGRWELATRAVGVMCSRGFVIEAELARTLTDALESDARAVAEGSLYALSRCARSSGELLAESRESLALAKRLEPFVRDAAAVEEPTLARLAWRVFAAIGELPDPIPQAALAARPSLAWTVEVEAARALGASEAGRQRIRERLRGIPLENFAGPRQHVLLAALQSMRGGIAGDARSTDAELTGIGQRLGEGRRSDDPRLRKLAALGSCELRLLQVIRTGKPEDLRGCEAQAGAPAIDPLPANWLANLEVEALLRATPATGAEGRTRDNLGTAAVDEGAALIGAGEGATEDRSVEAARRAHMASLLTMARDQDAARATPALAALAEVDDPAVLPVLRAALTRDDPGVLAAATTAIAVRSVDASKRDLEVVPLLEDLIRERRDAGSVEARLAAVEALGTLARSAVSVVTPEGVPGAEVGESPWLARTVVPLASDPSVAVRRRAREALLGHDDLVRAFDELEARGPSGAPIFGERLAADLEALLAEDTGAKGLRVTTSAGAFTIDFAGVASPINQANLAALAQAGFYEGLGFHRVVPGFVVQGGDPRGDGYGGPGYLVPCEWSNLRYVRGTVGMALAGKDTGGSQFFVTHTPQPHLDGRYTIIGQIRDPAELAVVDALLPGDRITGVEVLR